MAAGDLAIRIGADTSQASSAISQFSGLTSAELKKIAGYVTSMNREVARTGPTVQQAANQARAAYGAMEEGAGRAAHGNAGVTRELLVLTHELSQDNFKRAGGSLLVLAERMDLTRAITSATGLAVLSTVGAFVALGVLLAKGAIDAGQFAKQLQLTGNFAAVSQDQITRLAAAQSKLTGQTVGAARSSLEASAGSGLFGPAAFAQVARAMGDYEKLSGKNAEETLQLFSRLKDGAAKWAAETSQSVHFLTSTQYEQIKALQDAGEADDAAAMAVRLMAQTLEGRGTPAVGAFAQAWANVKKWASEAAQAVENIGRGPTTGSQIAALQAQLAELTKPGPRGSSADMSEILGRGGRTRGDMVDSVQRNIAALQAQEKAENGLRAAQASAEATNQAAVSARERIDALLTGAKAASAYSEALKKVQADFVAAAKGGSPVSANDQAAILAKLRKDFTPADTRKQADEYTNLVATVKAFTDTTAQEVGSLSKLTEGQRFVIQVQDGLTKSGKALTAAQRDSILADAKKAAAARDVADAELRAQKATLARITADTANAQSQQSLLDSVTGSGNDQANAVLRKIALIGKTTQEIFKFEELQKFDDIVGKALLGADNDTAERIQEIAKVMRTDLAGAIDTAKAAADAYNASFSNGFKDAMKDFVEVAKNQAEDGKKFFNDTIASMSDAIAEFATTGKLNIKSLADSIIQDFIRIKAKEFLGDLFGSTQLQGVVGAVSSFFGGGAAPGTGGEFANGLDYVPYDRFPAYLHEGERVLTKQDAATNRSGQGGHVFNFSQSYVIGEGVSRADVSAAVQQGQAQTEARMRRLLRNGSVVTA